MYYRPTFQTLSGKQTLTVAYCPLFHGNLADKHQICGANSAHLIGYLCDTPQKKFKVSPVIQSSDPVHNPAYQLDTTVIVH